MGASGREMSSEKKSVHEKFKESDIFGERFDVFKFKPWLKLQIDIFSHANGI